VPHKIGVKGVYAQDDGAYCGSCMVKRLWMEGKYERARKIVEDSEELGVVVSIDDKFVGFPE